jgi:hypothetical protein
VNTLYCLVEWKGEPIISPSGDNFTPRGQNSLLGDNFNPGGQSLPLVAKFRMGLWSQNLLPKIDVCNRVARFFLVYDTKTGNNIPMVYKMYRMVICKISQISIKFSKWP